MARKSRSESHDALEQIQTFGDRLAAWVGANPILVISTLVGILLLAAVIGGYRAYESSRLDEASAALAKVRQSYFEELGIDPLAGGESEPANPEIARRVRGDYVEQFLKVAEEHEGTAAAALARLQAGDLLHESGQSAKAIEVWQLAASEPPGSSPLRSLVLERIAVVHEAEGRWSEAAEAHEAAGQVKEFPARYLALADAARSYANAGQEDRALALYERVQQEAPEVSLPAHTRARLAELAARPAAAGAAAAPEPEAAAGSEPAQSGPAELDPAGSEPAIAAESDS